MTASLLTPSQAAADPALQALYESAFPREERIPWEELLRLVREMPLEFAEYRDGKELLGITIVYPRTRLSWFWYFAVPEEKRGRGIGQRILSEFLARYEGRSVVLDMEDPAQPDAPNPEQRRRRRDFYLRNGFRETGVGRTYGPVAMTILLRGDDTFTQADYSEITAELFRLWKPPHRGRRTAIAWCKSGARALLRIVLGCVAGLLTWWASSWIPVERDLSELETVGPVVRSGWPVWFMEQAPGISILSSFKPERALWNLVFWAAVWACFFCLVPLVRRALGSRRHA